MSDLTAANCGCSDTCGCDRSSGCNNSIWIILLLLLCNNNGRDGGCGFMNDRGGNSSCNILIWILLINCFCGGSNLLNFGNNNCGCGCN